MTDADMPTPPHEDIGASTAPGSGAARYGGRRQWGSAAGAALALSALYLAIVFVLPASLFWSPDEGAKYLQLESSRGHWPSIERQVPYGGRQIDPEYRFYPRPLPAGHRFELIGRIYPRPSVDGGVETNWPRLFSLLCLPLYSLLGFRGLYLVPVAAGIGTALLAGSLARRVVPEAEVPAILAVGLCTPVLFYSCLFWEHIIAVCLGMAALVLCTHKARLSAAAALAAVVCLAAAIAFRLELVVFAGALAIATIAAAVHHRMDTSARASAKMLRFGASAAIAMLGAAALWAGFDLVRRGETAALFGQKEHSLAQLLVGLLTSPRLWRELPNRLQQALIDLPADGGPALSPWLAWLGLLGALVAVVSFACRDPARSWSLVAGGALLTLVSLTTVLSPGRFRSIHALLLPAPYALFAVLLLFMPRPTGGRTRGILAATMVLVVASAVVLSLPLLAGGLEWGNRYQLIAYVLAATGCTTGMVFFARHGQPGWPRAAVTAAAGLALAVGGLYQARGLRELAMTKADLNTYRNAVATMSQPVVTDLY